MLKEASIADRLNSATFRMLGRTGGMGFRGVGFGMRGLAWAGKHTARGAARGMEFIGDTIARHPKRSITIGLPVLYGVSALPEKMGRSLNNISSEKSYLP